MQIVTEVRNVTAAGMQATRAFTVKAGAHIMSVLSGLYANPIDAMVREYLTNMYDAYLAKAKAVGMTIEQYVASPAFVPPVLTLPTAMGPELVFRDHGIGMDMETVWDVYTSYGESTKGGDNDAVGGFGLGSKTAFCYNGGATWTVESRKDGQAHLFMAAIGSDSVPRLDHVQSTSSKDHSGVTVRIPIRRSDFDAVHIAAARYVPHFPIPITVEHANHPIKPIAYRFKTAGWGLRMERERTYNHYHRDTGLTVIMGNVPYSVTDSTVFPAIVMREYEKGYFFGNNSVDLFLPVGAVDIVPSRDNLKYTDRTKQAISAAITKLMAELPREVSTMVAGCKTEWAALETALAFEEVPHLWAMVPQVVWGTKKVDRTRGIVRSRKVLQAMDPQAVITVIGINDGDRATLIEKTGDDLTMAPTRETVVVRDDLVKGTLTVARAMMYDRLVNKTSTGRTARYGHKRGHAIIIKSSVLTDAQIQDFFGGMPTSYLVKASQVTGLKVPAQVRSIGKDTLYRFSPASLRWEARVNIPTTDKTYYYLPLEKDRHSNRYVYVSNDKTAEVLEAARALKVLKTDAVIYGIKSSEIPNFDATVWLDLREVIVEAIKTFTKNNLEKVKYYFSPRPHHLSYLHDLIVNEWRVQNEHPLITAFVTAYTAHQTAATDATMIKIFAYSDETVTKAVNKLITKVSVPMPNDLAVAMYQKFPMIQVCSDMWANSYRGRNTSPTLRKVVLDYLQKMC